MKAFIPKKMEKITEQRQTTASVCAWVSTTNWVSKPGQKRKGLVEVPSNRVGTKVTYLAVWALFLQPSSLVPKNPEFSGLRVSTNSKQFHFWSKWTQFASFFNTWAKKRWHLKKDSVWLRGDGANGRKILLRKSKITWSWREDTCAFAALDFS